MMNDIYHHPAKLKLSAVHHVIETQMRALEGYQKAIWLAADKVDDDPKGALTEVLDFLRRDGNVDKIMNAKEDHHMFLEAYYEVGSHV